MKKISPVAQVAIGTRLFILQKAVYKSCCVLLLLFSCLLSAAQFKQDVALHRTAIPHASTSEAPSATPKSATTTVRSLIGDLKGKLAKIATVTKSSKTTPAEKTVLYAERVDEEHIMIYWNAAATGRNTTYIIERRLGDLHGPFDSVGTVTGRSTDPATQDYQLIDKNTFRGNTFYRLRQTGLAANEKINTSVMVSSGNRGLQVSTAPPLAQSITVTLSKFKIAPRTHLYITDAHGSLVYQKKNVFFSTGHTIELTGLQLPRGTYQIEVTNHYNTGVNTLVIR